MELKWTFRFCPIQRRRLRVSAGLVAQSLRFLVAILAISTGGRGGFFFSVRRSGTTGRGRGGNPSALECWAGGLGGGAGVQVYFVSSLLTELSRPNPSSRPARQSAPMKARASAVNQKRLRCRFIASAPSACRTSPPCDKYTQKTNVPQLKVILRFGPKPSRPTKKGVEGKAEPASNQEPVTMPGAVPIAAQKPIGIFQGNECRMSGCLPSSTTARRPGALGA